MTTDRVLSLLRPANGWELYGSGFGLCCMMVCDLILMDFSGGAEL